MPRSQWDKNNMGVITVKMKQEDVYKFKRLVVLNEHSINSILKQAVYDYIDKYTESTSD